MNNLKDSAFINANPETPVIPIYEEGFIDGAKIGTFYGWIFGMVTMAIITLIIINL